MCVVSLATTHGAERKLLVRALGVLLTTTSATPLLRKDPSAWDGHCGQMALLPSPGWSAHSSTAGFNAAFQSWARHHHAGQDLGRGALLGSSLTPKAFPVFIVTSLPFCLEKPASFSQPYKISALQKSKSVRAGISGRVHWLPGPSKGETSSL